MPRLVSSVMRFDKASGKVIEYGVEQVGRRRRLIAKWPIHSDAAGVNPVQIPEAEEYARKMGVPTEFDKEGCPIFTGPRHRKHYCERVAGLYDRNGGYGDPMPGENSKESAPEFDEEKVRDFFGI